MLLSKFTEIFLKPSHLHIIISCYLLHEQNVFCVFWEISFSKHSRFQFYNEEFWKWFIIWILIQKNWICIQPWKLTQSWYQENDRTRYKLKHLRNESNSKKVNSFCHLFQLEKLSGNWRSKHSGSWEKHSWGSEAPDATLNSLRINFNLKTLLEINSDLFIINELITGTTIAKLRNTTVIMKIDNRKLYEERCCCLREQFIGKLWQKTIFYRFSKVNIKHWPERLTSA